MNSSEEFFCVKEIHTMQNCVSFVHIDLLWGYYLKFNYDIINIKKQGAKNICYDPKLTSWLVDQECSVIRLNIKICVLDKTYKVLHNHHA